MKKYLKICLIIMIAVSCKKDDTDVVFSLPAKTNTGENTFGFLFNSRVWVNYGKVCFVFQGCRENLDGDYYPSNGDMKISADRVLYKNGSWNTSESFDIYLSTKYRGPGTYSTSTNDNISLYYEAVDAGSQDEKTYTLSQTNPNFSVTVTRLDSLNNIISGEFKGTLYRRLSDTSFATSLTDSIVISEGRFDIKKKLQ